MASGRKGEHLLWRMEGGGHSGAAGGVAGGWAEEARRLRSDRAGPSQGRTGPINFRSPFHGPDRSVFLSVRAISVRSTSVHERAQKTARPIHPEF